jgi:flagellar motility protein MotE (MotC chaperone)
MLTDTSPTLDDTAPTLATTAEAGGHGGAPAAEEIPAAGEHGAPAAAPEGEGSSADPAAAHGETSEAIACPPVDPALPSEAAGGHDPAPAPEVSCDPLAAASSVPVNEFGDAVPTVRDASGKIVPLQEAEGQTSEAALLQRLAERRAELDKRDQDLVLRAALVEAAEKKLDERTRALADLEARIAALVDEKQAAEDAGFRAVVSMYETMKPKDAAKIFDTLHLQVLLKVARAMNPRKMSPILAAMGASQAEALTTAFATTDTTQRVADGGENLAALPQIVGQ